MQNGYCQNKCSYTNVRANLSTVCHNWQHEKKRKIFLRSPPVYH